MNLSYGSKKLNNDKIDNKVNPNYVNKYPINYYDNYKSNIYNDSNEFINDNISDLYKKSSIKNSKIVNDVYRIINDPIEKEKKKIINDLIYKDIKSIKKTYNNNIETMKISK